MNSITEAIDISGCTGMPFSKKERVVTGVLQHFLIDRMRRAVAQ
jgi:hypothetical protein